MDATTYNNLDKWEKQHVDNCRLEDGTLCPYISLSGCRYGEGCIKDQKEVA